MVKLEILDEKLPAERGKGEQHRDEKLLRELL